MKTMIVFSTAAFVFFTAFSGAAPAGSKTAMELTEGVAEVRPGLLAYGDFWHLMFWRDGQHAGQMSSHNKYNLNIDLMNFHGVYKGGRVLARVDGPGVIYRIWSAGPTGSLRFYADGDQKPTLSADFKGYLAGADFSEPAFAVGRYANYTPIPFLRSMIVTAKRFRLAGAYYQVSYMTFDQDPGIKTLAPDRSHQDQDDLEKAKKFWESQGRSPARDPGGIPLELESRRELGPGESHRILLDGAGLITELRIVDLDDPLDPLSELTLEIYWDRNDRPAVWSPVDAFFGNLFDSRKNSQAGPYETLAVSATEEGYSSRWPMPFARGMELAIKNQGESTHRLQVGLTYRGLERLSENAMRFHALYREVDYPTELTRENIHGLFFRVDQSANYVALERSGRGYFVGCFLYVISLGSDWWGEGDEMIWVDGDPRALIQGTGTEDEFNWSYGFKENRSPISGTLRVGKRKSKLPQTTQGFNVLYRYRLGDFIPFRENIKVTFERLGMTNNWMKRHPLSLVNVSQHRGDDYRSVAYWFELP